MYKGKTVAAIIVAAGKSTRMGFDKLFALVNGKPVLWHTVHAFLQTNVMDEIVIVAGQNKKEIENLFENNHDIKIVEGGAERYRSVENGVRATDADIIAIHDGARPFVSQKIILDTLEKAYATSAAAPAVPCKDTIKVAENDMVKCTPNRNTLFAVQTPQIFDRALYIKAMNHLPNKASITDDCTLIELLGEKVYLTQGDYQNIKITTPEDLLLYQPKTGEEQMRIGHGYDVHKLVTGRAFILGGVHIPFDKGLDGHSDADVLAHAITDALLGATAMGDIGKLFPDTDETYKNADSILLLKEVNKRIQNAGYIVANIDATILCQKPKLAPYIMQMRACIADALQLSIDDVSIKATTEEGLGFTGNGEGVAVHSVCIVTKR